MAQRSTFLRAAIACIAMATGFAAPGHAASPACALVTPTQLRQLPFNAAQAHGRYGFALVDDSLEGQSSDETMLSLRIAGFDPVTGGFNGTVVGPVAQTDARYTEVTGVIAPNQGSDFAVAFSFGAADRSSGSTTTWVFHGTLHAFVLPGTPGRPCSLELQIDGTMAAGGPAITRGPVYGPSPFSGVGIVLAAR